MPTTYAPVMLGPVPLDFLLFACILLGIALLHRHTLAVALTGLAVVTIYKVGFSGFRTGAGFEGLLGLLAHEWVSSRRESVSLLVENGTLQGRAIATWQNVEVAKTLPWLTYRRSLCMILCCRENQINCIRVTA